MVLQAPISRHQSGDRTLTGATTMIARTNQRQTTADLDDKLNSFFRHHALAGPRLRHMSGTLGSGEESNVTAQRLPLGGDSSTYTPLRSGSFGTKDTKRSIVDLIHDMEKTRPRRSSGASRAVDLVESRRMPARNSGGKLFRSKPRWNTKDNIASPKFSGYN